MVTSIDLTGYVDESGHADDPRCRYVGLAGMVAPAKKWEQFEEDWKAALDKFIGGVPFHMKAFVMQPAIPPYQGWDETKRRDFLNALVKAIKDAGPIPFGSVVSLDDWELLEKELPGAGNLLGGEPYFLAFQDVTRAASLQAMPFNFPFSDRNEKVSMVYGVQDEYGAITSPPGTPDGQLGRAEGLWHAMKRMTNIGHFMGTYASDYPKDVMPLQAADLFAYELTKEFENRRNRPKDSMRWALAELLPLAGERMLHKFYTIEVLMESLMDMGALILNNDQSASLSINADMQKIGMRNFLNLRLNQRAKKKS